MMRNKDKTKPTFFLKFSFTASFTILPLPPPILNSTVGWGLSSVHCTSATPPFSHLFPAQLPAPQDTVLHKLLQCGCPHKVQCLNRLFYHGSPMSCSSCHKTSFSVGFSPPAAVSASSLLQWTLHELQLSSGCTHFLWHGILYGLQCGSAPPEPP